jgi:uncharacterized protein (TIGR02266 family)
MKRNAIVQTADAIETREERTEAVVRALSMVPGTDNRRIAPRFAVELEMSISSEHNFYSGLVENISEGGVFVATHVLKPIGSVVEISITLPDSDVAVSGKGEVRWIRDYNELSDTPPGMGIRFVELASGSVEAIEQFLSQRDPLFFDE